MLVNKIKFLLRFLSLTFILASVFLVLPSAAHADSLNTLSGNFTDRAGNVVANAPLQIDGATTGTRTYFSTDANGHYSVNVAPDKYAIRFGGNYNYGTQKIFLFNSTNFIDATGGNVTQDLQLDTVAVNVSFVDQQNNPISNAQVSVESYSGQTTLAVGRPDLTFLTADTLAHPGATNASGVLPTTVLRGIKYYICAVNPSTNISTCAFYTPTTDTSTFTLTAPPVPHTISGTLTDHAGNPVANVPLQIGTSSQSIRDYASVSTDANGHYSVSVNPDHYTIRFANNYTYSGQQIFLFTTQYFIDATTGNVAQDLQLDNVALNVNFVDANNNPIPNAHVSFESYSGQTSFAIAHTDVPFLTGDIRNSITGVTDSNGVLPTSVLRGLKYYVCALNPATNVSTCGFITPSNDTSTFTLTSPRPTAPTNLTAPTPTKQLPSLTWSAVSGVDHYDVYRDGNKIGSTLNTTYTDTTVSEGSHSYYVLSVDSTGVGSDPSPSVTVVYDVTAPSITYTLSPAANNNAWTNSDVTVTFSCSDNLSGIQSCPSPVTISAEGSNQTVNGTTTDNAGNSASTTVNVNLDKTAPTITASVDRQPNANGWYGGDVTIAYTCSDSLSDVQYCPAPVTVSTEGANQIFNGTAVDNAGNTASVTTTLNVDKSAPTITASVSTPPNLNGWNNGAVTITFNCSDVLSGVASCTSPVTVTTDGANQVVTGTAVDNAGNVSTTTAIVSIDSTKPTIVATQAPVANANGWNNTAVVVSFTCKDSLSGISSCSSPVTLSNEGKNQSASGMALDNAGNTNTVTLVGINIDKTAPTASNANIAPTPVHLNKPNTETITATAVDTGTVQSGVVGGEYYIDTDPGVGNGTAMTFSSSNNQLTATQLSNTFTKGNHTLYIRSCDAAGNWSTTTSTTFKVS